VKGKLICFIGMDGAGKTTLTVETARRLRDRGIRVARVYGRMVPVISRLLMVVGRSIFLRKHDTWQDYPNYVEHKKRVLRNPLLSRFHEASIWLDYLPQAFLKITLPLSLGLTVVCDRYLFDTVIGDLAVHLSYDNERVRRLLDSSFRFLPRPDRVFFIDLPEEIAIQRKDDVPHTAYLRERREFYLHISELYPMSKLDGQENPEMLMTEVMQHIDSLYLGEIENL
jgi:thymidylate kinase